MAYNSDYRPNSCWKLLRTFSDFEKPFLVFDLVALKVKAAKSKNKKRL